MKTSVITFTRGNIGHHVLVMSSTSAIALLATFLTDILTLTYIALLHDEPLVAAVGIAKTLAFFNASLVTGIIVAAGTMISRRIGQGTCAALPALISHMLLLSTLAATVIALIQWRYLDFFADLLGANLPASAVARPFIAMTLLAAPLMTITQAAAQALRASGHSGRALAVVLTAALCLALVDPILIFVLDLKLWGAGLSCLFSGIVGSVVGLVQLRRHVGLTMNIRWRLVRLYGVRINRVALPFTLASLAMPLALTYAMAQLAKYGVSAMAGMALMDRILQITYCLYFALPSALVPILAQNLGAGAGVRVQATLRSACKLVIGHGLAVWALLLVAAPWLGPLFGLSGPGQHLVEQLCRFGPGLWLLIGLDFIALSLFISSGRVWWVPAFAWLRATVGSVPFVWAGAQAYGASGVMLGLWCGNALIAVISIVTAVAINRRARIGRTDTGCLP
ncbi:multidrug transporter MatE [Pseudomonas sp. LB-090624]|uniref:MATE family efflux transporter n=1 Tax=Pseudomonas sp. LB-090624 TaxID=2213079 RepID=UPI000D8813CE|nr:MATE family efflux transporter [Pseudomonas sp. LB-090624]PYB80991.1 multidrug transporter MatE [Pseudomonas sp. LB-090624]